MLRTTLKASSLLGAPKEVVREWVGQYIQQSGCGLTIDELVSAALQEQGTNEGVTKTKTRIARRRLVNGKAQ